MYGDANELTISRRTIREISAIWSTATVTAGRTSDDHWVNPADGRIGRSTAKMVSSISPVQKSGIDCPAMVTTLAANSRRVSARRAIQVPSGYRNHGGEQDGRDREGDRVRQPAQHHVERRCLKRVRRPQIELQQPLEVEQVLHEHRLIKAHVGPDTREVFAGGQRACHRIRRVAGCHPDQHENSAERQEHGEQTLRESFRDVAGHGSPAYCFLADRRSAGRAGARGFRELLCHLFTNRPVC